MNRHWLARATASATFCLLILGGVVHGTGSSLACPDWPTCYGSFVPEMKNGVQFEHSHRLLGATVGLLTFGLALALHRNEREERALRLAGWGALGMVVFQGLLGGLTVKLRLPPIVSITHLATGMAFFCFLLWIAWRTRSGAETAPSVAIDRIRGWVGASLVAVYLQIVLGALMRHAGAGLACTDVPLCGGSLWPAGAHATVHIHMLHRIFGVLVGLLLVVVSTAVMRRTPKHSPTRRLASLLPWLVVAQIPLGFLSVTSGLGVATVAAHLGVGALLLGTTFLLWLSLPLAEARSNEASAQHVTA